LRHELIDGEHYVTPSPNTKHQSVSINLTVQIGSWLERNPIGRLFHAPFDVVFSHFDVVEPDLLYMSNARAADVLRRSTCEVCPSSSSKSVHRHTKA
jgi:Uma2 family endonuclease